MATKTQAKVVDAPTAEDQMMQMPAAHLQQVLNALQAMPFGQVYQIIPLVMQATPVEK